MNVEPNILFAVHKGAPFVGHDGNDHNLLPKGRPLIMRFRKLSLASEPPCRTFSLPQLRVLHLGLFQMGMPGSASFNVDSGLAAPRTCSGTVSLPIAIR